MKYLLLLSMMFSFCAGAQADEISIPDAFLGQLKPYMNFGMTQKQVEALYSSRSPNIALGCFKNTPVTLDAKQSDFSNRTTLCMNAPSEWGPITCYNATPVDLDKSSSAILCQRAKSAAPMTCYNATPVSLPKELSALLCSGAESTTPVACYNQTSVTMPLADSARLCSGAYVANGPIRCFEEVKNWLTSKDGAVLCEKAEGPNESSRCVGLLSERSYSDHLKKILKTDDQTVISRSITKLCYRAKTAYAIKTCVGSFDASTKMSEIIKHCKQN